MSCQIIFFQYPLNTLPDSFECFIPFDNSTDRIDNFKGVDVHGHQISRLPEIPDFLLKTFVIISASHTVHICHELKFPLFFGTDIGKSCYHPVQLSSIRCIYKFCTAVFYFPIPHNPVIILICFFQVQLLTEIFNGGLIQHCLTIFGKDNLPHIFCHDSFISRNFLKRIIEHRAHCGVHLICIYLIMIHIYIIYTVKIASQCLNNLILACVCPDLFDQTQYIFRLFL